MRSYNLDTTSGLDLVATPQRAETLESNEKLPALPLTCVWSADAQQMYDGSRCLAGLSSPAVDRVHDRTVRAVQGLQIKRSQVLIRGQIGLGDRAGVVGQYTWTLSTNAVGSCPAGTAAQPLTRTTVTTTPGAAAGWWRWACAGQESLQ